MELSKQAQYVFEDCQKLAALYDGVDLSHDAHGIFRYALDANKLLTLRHDCHPLAVRMARKLIDRQIECWRAAQAV